jgi:hypothetical protein
MTPFDPSSLRQAQCRQAQDRLAQGDNRRLLLPPRRDRNDKTKDSSPPEADQNDPDKVGAGSLREEN